MTEQIKLTNVTLNWAFLGHKNDKGDYASGKYEATVILTPQQAAQLKEQNLSAKQKIKETEDGMFKITLKSNKEPVVLNSDGIAMTTAEKDRVGNGSVANMFVTIFETRGQKFAGLGKILVKKLVEYSGSSSAADLMDDDTATSTSELEDD